jgi:hypothetical protein
MADETVGKATPTSVKRALGALVVHPYAASVGNPTWHAELDHFLVDVEMVVDLPNAHRAPGETPSGVRARETITIGFPQDYPLRPPILFLRAGFSRSVAHVQPWLTLGRPVPCIYDGRISELVASAGIIGVMDQISEWLNRAALGTLIDPRQGWEPTRRDDLNDVVVADGDWLRGEVTKGGGHLFAPFHYGRLDALKAGGVPYVHGTIASEHLPLNAERIREACVRKRKVGGIEIGDSLALFVWPGSGPDGKPFVADEYLPEDVSTLTDLYVRAERYGCRRPLEEALRWLTSCLTGYHADFVSPLAIVLAARRPFNVIGKASDLELCPYMVEISPPAPFRDPAAVFVRIVGHRDAVSVPLLRRMSGEDAVGAEHNWTLLGAGSLGSKVAMHLARMGRAPSAIVDSGHFNPHNAARHALLPDMTNAALGHKATLLATAIGELGQTSRPEIADVLTVIEDGAKRKDLLSRRKASIVNMTASLVVREALASLRPPKMPTRVIEGGLFGRGAAGFVTIEGPGRNPDTLDLTAEMYRVAGDGEHASAIFGDASAHDRISIGDGCGSPTMPMSDARISAFAAPMATLIGNLQVKGLSDQAGELCLGVSGPDSLSMTWYRQSMLPSIIIASRKGEPWSVRISMRVHGLITEEVARWPYVETGGVLLGRFSEITRTFYVVDLLPAPEDSTRAKDLFMLGKRGLRAALRAYSGVRAGALYCLGTWHSHLDPSGPSRTDLTTAALVAASQIPPTLSLIHTPSGYNTIIAERAARRT